MRLITKYKWNLCTLQCLFIFAISLDEPGFIGFYRNKICAWNIAARGTQLDCRSSLPINKSICWSFEFEIFVRWANFLRQEESLPKFCKINFSSSKEVSIKVKKLALPNHISFFYIIILNSKSPRISIKLKQLHLTKWFSINRLAVITSLKLQQIKAEDEMRVLFTESQHLLMFQIYLCVFPTKSVAFRDIRALQSAHAYVLIMQHWKASQAAVNTLMYTQKIIQEMLFPSRRVSVLLVSYDWTINFSSDINGDIIRELRCKYWPFNVNIFCIQLRSRAKIYTKIEKVNSGWITIATVFWKALENWHEK